MIRLEPSWDEIDALPTPLTDGERHFIKRIEDLYKEDDRDLEVFVQANINGDRPDIIVTERGGGIWIVEVKDWNLHAYSVEEGRWYVDDGNGQHLIKSPFRQVEQYKKNFFSMHSYYLAERNMHNRNVYGMIRCGVYFHCATEIRANDYKNLEYGNANNGRFMHVFGHNTADALIRNFFRHPLIRIENHEYDHLMRYIRPSEEARPVREISYNEKQRSLIQSMPKHQKVKGVAGSGKSLVLAARAVNALKRTNGRVLIITFNITLMNYLHDRISEVRGTYRRKDFYINSYHTFINAECNNLGIQTGDLGNFEAFDSHYQDINLFERCKNRICKYDAIFIDEVQDFRYEWQQILFKYFLKENGEFVLFGDEKQNIYNRELENRKIRTIVKGRWNELTESYRLANKTIALAKNFQKYFFADRYDLDVIHHQSNQLNTDLIAKNVQLEFDVNGSNDEIHYVYTQNVINELNRINQFFREKQLHPNDIVFLGTNKTIMRNIDYSLRQSGERTTTMFTRLEEYNELLNNPVELNLADREIERARKVGFWMNTGCVKVSTIQSFKGWEANTVILIIQDDYHNQETIHELLYTGITRCKKNLIILNERNVHMHEFFTQNIVPANQAFHNIR